MRGVRGWVLLGGALGLLAGVALQLVQSALWPGQAALALSGLAIALAAAGWLARGKVGFCAASIALAAAAAGFAGTTLRAQARLAETLAPALEGRDLTVTGIVAELPRRGVDGMRFVFEPDAASVQAAHPLGLPPRLMLGWYRGAEPDALLLGPNVEVRAGQRWRFTVRLRRPHGSFNPHGFDTELWLFEQGIGATGYVRSRAGDTAQLLEENADAPLERLRQRVRDAIERDVSDPARAGVIAALAIGDQGAIGREDWALFRDTGVAHLMSISGLHVTMFAWLAGGLIGWLWRRSGRALLLVPAPQAARLGGVLAALGYALLAGWGVPAQRTVWMLAAVALLRSAGLNWPLHAVLLAAACVVTLADPWALLQPGFWLSFVAVALLSAAEPAASAAAHDPEAPVATRAWRLRAVLASALRTQAIATVGLAPLTLIFFQQLSLVGFVANLIAIPVITLGVTPLALLGIVFAPLWQVASWILGALMALLQALAAWPAAVWSAAAAPVWAAVAGLAGGALAVLPLPWRLRACAVPLMLPLLAPPITRPAEGQFELVAADIGQGTAVLVRTRSHLLVYDAGPQLGAQSDAGSRVLVPLLRARGERRIDLLMLSHRDADHVGGAAALMAAVAVGELSSSLEPVHPLLASAAGSRPHRRCDAGQRWTWDGVAFEVLHPRAEDHFPGADVKVKPNALSCVLRIVDRNGRSALLTGDIEAAQELALVQREAAALKVELLLVPHHGSRTSSTSAFLDAVAPRTAIVQAAYRSRFGHPAPDVLARYAARGIAVQRSDRCGAFTWAADGGARCEREAARRYWHHRDAEPPAGGTPGAERR